MARSSHPPALSLPGHLGNPPTSSGFTRTTVKMSPGALTIPLLSLVAAQSAEQAPQCQGQGKPTHPLEGARTPEPALADTDLVPGGWRTACSPDSLPVLHPWPVCSTASRTTPPSPTAPNRPSSQHPCLQALCIVRALQNLAEMLEAKKPALLLSRSQSPVPSCYLFTSVQLHTEYMLCSLDYEKQLT